MRLVLGALLGAAVGVIATTRRSPSGHRPPQPRYAGDQRASAAEHGGQPTAQEQPSRSALQASKREGQSDDGARERRESRYRRYELVVGAATAAATVAAAAFAFLAYTAALDAVSETRRQADIAQDALVASTRARLKVTFIKDITATRSEGGMVAWFWADAAYKNFGQSPAQNIFLSLRMFVVGAGPSPIKTCEEAKASTAGHSFEVVFPQSDEGGNGYGAQVLLGRLKAGAAEVRAVQPDAPVYLGLIGCLTYQSAASGTVYVTGFSGDLHLADTGPDDGQVYRPAYDAIVDADGPVKVGLKLKTLSAWTD